VTVATAPVRESTGARGHPDRAPRITATPASTLPPVPLPSALLARRRALLICLHFVLFPAIYALAYALRFDFAVPEQYVVGFLHTAPLLTLLRFGAFWALRLYNGWWRHTGVYDLYGLLRATTVSTLLFVLLTYMLPGKDAPRSVVLMDWVLTILICGGARVGVRWIRESMVVGVAAGGGRRALIVGAGDDAARLIREFRLDPGCGVHPVGIVDDEPSAQGRHIHGVPVLGAVSDVIRDLARQRIDLVIVAKPMASRDEVRRLVELCAGDRVEIKMMPSLAELVDGRTRLSQLRAVAVEDLLGRQPIKLDLTAIRSIIRGRTVLVTGGAGSIGSELARQIARYEPARLVLLDKAESPLYYIDLELRKLHPELELVPVIGDVACRATVADLFERYRPQVAFHAAAYKHVPLMEANPGEAIRNNVLGTLIAAEVAAEYGAEKFVLISTDKAVHPSSVMGATKRIAELLLTGLPNIRDAQTEFRAVRFGNVLGSDGSVVPVFKRQISEGGPVTVTHPDVTRYFMTIPEAVQLVLQSAALPEASGRVAMLDMGEPVRIVELAENLIRLSGLEPYTEMPIVFTGLRPGEKLCEDLSYEVERAIPTAVEKIRIVQSADSLRPEGVASGLDRLMDSLAVGNVDLMLDAVRALVPECVAPLCNRRASVAPLSRPTVAAVASRS
jgi:FlaA1/EpsC-like NDP-sugar epimerase